MSDKSLLKRAGSKVASLHQTDQRPKAKVIATRQGEKDLAAPQDEVRAARERDGNARPHVDEVWGGGVGTDVQDEPVLAQEHLYTAVARLST